MASALNNIGASSILIIAGEASGDTRGAELMAALQEKHPHLKFFGIGGDLMAKAGMHIVHHAREMAFLGFFEVIRHFPFIRKVFREMTDLLETERPDLVILIDYPGFNLRFAKQAKKRGIRVVYYISPQIWAWNQNRIHKIRETVDHMIVLFPFEETLYREAGVPATFVGHPLKETFQVNTSKSEFYKSLGLNADFKTLALLPGSRKQEVERLLPEMIRSSRILKQDVPQLQILLCQSPTLSDTFYRVLLQHNPDIHLIEGQTHRVLNHSDAALVASGTATLEAALAGVPMVVLYKMAPLSYLLARLLVRVQYIGLVNIVAGRGIVPELIQGAAHAERISETIRPFLMNSEQAQQARANLAEVSEKLGESGAAERAADVILQELPKTGIVL
ncbi:lipid-A-disaccharide synthase [candidate division KSB1 bacterium]|nr:lipid-A-disaccharide synthase [candidate division KSB1 bacterium]